MEQGPLTAPTKFDQPVIWSDHTVSGDTSRAYRFFLQSVIEAVGEKELGN